MKAYAADGARAYHTPGHKQGLGAHPLLKALVTEEGLREEVSLMEELDDLHEPTMCIKEAQEMAAALYGADQAFFMINGTTGAIHTMLMGALAPGDTSSCRAMRTARSSAASSLQARGPSSCSPRSTSASASRWA